jgi:hypothetical protein
MSLEGRCGRHRFLLQTEEGGENFVQRLEKEEEKVKWRERENARQ